MLAVVGLGQLPLPAQTVAADTRAADVQSLPPPTELRGVWLTNIDSEVLFSRQNLRRGLERLARLNFNTIYPTVWNGGYTLFPSQVAARTLGRSLDPTPGLQGRDTLQEAIATGHRLGMAVIPWFEFGLMAPANSELAKRHPDWLAQRQDGSTVWMQGNLPRVWLNPAHPEVQQFLVNLVAETVQRYDVDGIQFDDHFGMAVDFGYDPITVEQYRQSHNGSDPPNNPTDSEWVRWRAAKLTQLLEQIAAVIHAAQPDSILSLSPNPRNFAYERYLQDWGRWERRGLVQELIVQVYRNDFNRFQMEIERPEVQAARDYLPVGIGILSGLRARISPMEQIWQQVQAVRERGYAGVAFFFYETIGQRDAVFRAMFPTPARRPVFQG
ncbi:MAG TPA: family 10 glycosylhydrolase [Synechococcales cyanobacterium M55_K2018_004]|nr:family 10 glycosylhydrolase [Synechococcales cyanobacterium M55_K2018_004]